jgi:Fe-S cluster assembly protein SufD
VGDRGCRPQGGLKEQIVSSNASTPSVPTVALDALGAIVPERSMGAAVPWLDSLIGQARERATHLPIPTSRDEAWRFTDLAPLARQGFAPQRAPVDLDPEAFAPFAIDEAAAARLVFIDGVLAPQWSSLAQLPAGVQLSGFAEALTRSADAVRAHFAQHARADGEFFSALNTARLSDCATLIVGRNVQATVPLHLLFLASRQPAPVASETRLLVIAESGAEVTLIEEYASLGEGMAFTNALGEISVAANASVRHVRLQRENAASYHVGRCAVNVERDARYASVSLNTGSRLSRLDLEVRLAGEGAQASLDGLALIGARQHSDTHTLLDHAVPNATSRQLHKCVCDGGSHAVFNGRILVRPDAQRTDSAQQSRALLLSPKAQVNAKPQLEIFADDVKAAHGATVGQIDGDELFYLVSRGLPQAQARKLLTYAFAAEVIECIPVRSLVRRLAAQVMAKAGLQQ